MRSRTLLQVQGQARGRSAVNSAGFLGFAWRIREGDAAPDTTFSVRPNDMVTNPQQQERPPTAAR